MRSVCPNQEIVFVHVPQALQGALRVPPRVLGTLPNKIFPGAPRHQRCRGSWGTTQCSREPSQQNLSWTAAPPTLRRLLGYHPGFPSSLPTEQFLECRATSIPACARHSHPHKQKTLRKQLVWVQRCSFYVRPVHIGSQKERMYQWFFSQAMSGAGETSIAGAWTLDSALATICKRCSFNN